MNDLERIAAQTVGEVTVLDRTEAVVAVEASVLRRHHRVLQVVGDLLDRHRHDVSLPGIRPAQNGDGDFDSTAMAKYCAIAP